MADDNEGTGTEQDAAKLQEALRKEREARKADQAKLREAEEKARRLDELEGASKSEQQKAADRIAQLEAELAKSAGKAARIEAALEAGLPFRMANRLQGDTAEELLADAKALAEELGGTGGKGADDGKGDDDGKGREGRARTGDADASGGGPELSMSDRIRLAAGRGRVAS